MRIKFVGNSLLENTHVPPGRDAYTNRAFYGATINMAPFLLKHFYSLYGLTPGVKWLRPDLLKLDDLDTMIDDIKKEQIDILALPVFIWNESLQMSIAQRIKQDLPDVTIVLGGPHLTAHKDTGFFEKYPYVDYVVYGDGERAFQKIIDYESGVVTDQEDFVNTVTRDRVFPYEQLTDALYFSTSPYLEQKEFIKDSIQYLIDRGVPKGHIVVPLEFTRGCMYRCTFCDWSQNLTKKVKRTARDWRAELDFFKELDLVTREADANFGQWDEDIEIYDYALSIFDPDKNFRFLTLSKPKLKADSIIHFIINNAKHYGTITTFTFMDIDDQVLRSTDRPSLGWDRYLPYIKKLREQPDFDFDKMASAQLMIGLADQTYDGLIDSLLKIWRDGGIYNLFLNHWEMVPNSPGNDEFYKKLHKITDVAVKHIQDHRRVSQAPDLEAVYEMAQNSTDPNVFLDTRYVFSTATMTFPEMMAAAIFVDRLRELKTKFNPGSIKNIDLVFNNLKKSALTSANRQFAEIDHLREKYGFIVRGSYDAATHKLHNYWKYI